MTQRGIAMNEARVLLEEVSGRRFADLFADLDDTLRDEQIDQLESLVRERLSGVPLQHLIGHWPFRELELTVDGRALIPRPETEELVSVALAQLELARKGATATDLLRRFRVVDLGSGSGAIACSIAHEDTDTQVYAIERSLGALSLVADNVAQLDANVRTRITVLEGDWYQPLRDRSIGEVDLIVANPPYVTLEEWQQLDSVVRDHDPVEALVAGQTGLEDLAVIIAEAPEFLRDGGSLVCEIGSTQGEATRSLATRAGARTVEVKRDLSGRERILVATFAS